MHRTFYEGREPDETHRGPGSISGSFYDHRAPYVGGQRNNQIAQVEPPLYPDDVRERGDLRGGKTSQKTPSAMPRRWPLPHLLGRKRAKAKLDPRQRRRRRLIRLGLVLLIIALLVTQANGPLGAQAADLMRAVLGPQITAQIESWYLAAQDAVHRAEYQLTGGHTSAPWQGSGTPAPSSTTGMPLPPIKPLIAPGLPGEGVWTTQGLPNAGSKHPPLVAKTFLRPDPERPFAVVTVLQFDLRFVRLHLVAGTTQPGGPLNNFGPGVIPVPDQQGQALIAAFNGGFKYADGQYGMMVDGAIYVPPQPGLGTIAITTDGRVLLGAWGRDPGLTPSNPDLAAWRQNEALLVDGGQINPLTQDGAAWGGTLLAGSYTWRSGVGITKHGTLLYAAGNSLSAAMLGKVLQAAGATMAMQTDINAQWVHAFTYERAPGGAWNISKLDSSMQGSGDEYLRGSERDFFYITRASGVPNGT